MFIPMSVILIPTFNHYNRIFLYLIDSVWERFGDKLVLKDESLVVHSGEVVGLLGPRYR